MDVGHRVITAIGGVDSARSTNAIEELRHRMGAHRQIPVVREFLNFAA